MPVIVHADQPVHRVPRIRTRILVHETADQTALWEQWIDEGGFIPIHYHEEEELLVILQGEVELTLDGQTQHVAAPATILIPARQLHDLRPFQTAVVHLFAFFPTPSPQIFDPDGTLRPLPWNDSLLR